MRWWVFKLLGVMVQNDLKWNCHVNDIVKRASMRLHMLRILKGFRLPVCDLVSVYCSYVRPVVEYCAPLAPRLTEHQRAKLKEFNGELAASCLGRSTVIKVML